MSSLHDPNQGPLSELQVNGAQLPQRTLLYIEDNPANLLLFEQLIARRSDLKLLSAVTGKLGIQLARENKPDVILLDINMPGASGYEIIATLHEDPAMIRTPLIALSSNARPRDIKKGLEAGFLRYITKPYKIDELFDAIDFALNYAAENFSTK